MFEVYSNTLQGINYEFEVGDAITAGGLKGRSVLTAGAMILITIQFANNYSHCVNFLIFLI